MSILTREESAETCFSGEIRPIRGLHEPEVDPSGAFTWTRTLFALDVLGAPTGRKLLKLEVENIVQEGLEVEVLTGEGLPLDRLRLPLGRGTHFAIGLPDEEDFQLEFRVEGRVGQDLRGPDDRELGLKLYRAEIFPLRTREEILRSKCFEVPEHELKAVFIELTTSCNIRCLMCPQMIGNPARPRHLDPRWLPRVLELTRDADLVDLHGIGEPLLSPLFTEVVQALPFEDPRVFFNCNGTTIREEHLQVILGGKVRGINFSLDATTKDLYRLIRGFDLDVVLGNIRRVIRERNARGLSVPEVFINMTLMRMNLHEAPAMVDLAADLGADAVFLWHLNHDRMNNRWVVERDGFTFDYRAQMALDEPERTNRMLAAAHERARERGVRLVPDHSRRYFGSEDSGEANPSAGTRALSLNLREFRLPYEELFLDTSSRVRLSCFQNDYFTRTRLEGFGEQDSLFNSEEHRAARYLMLFDRPSAPFRGGGNKYLEHTCLTGPRLGLFLAERDHANARGLLPEPVPAGPLRIHYRWTTAQVTVTVPWEEGKTPLAAQIFSNTPDVGQGAPEIQIHLEGRRVFHGVVPFGPWSCDLLLDWEEAGFLARRSELWIDLSILNPFEASRISEETRRAHGVPEDARPGIGLVALAVV